MLRAAELVAHVMEGGNLTDAFERMAEANAAWPDGTRGAVRDLAWSTLRDYGRGDAILRQLLHSAPAVLIHGLLLVALMRLVQRPEQAHTVVDQAVQAAAVAMPGLKGMVNGVLRNALRQWAQWPAWVDADDEARHAYPRWWVERVRKNHPKSWQAVLEAGNGRPPMALRVNRRRASVEAVLAELEEAGIAARAVGGDTLLLAHPLALARLPGYAEGRVSVQDAGAQRAAPLLAPRAGERVLDACAAPGGKTAHLLELADVELLALELDPRRAQRIRRNLDRLGLDARIQVADCSDVGNWWDGRPFDRILADVPCSASGVVRRHPDIKWLRRDEDIAAFAAQQARIVDALWQTLAPGGTMLYVTCSVFEQENTAQVVRFLDRHADAEPVPIEASPDCPLLPDAEHDGFYFACLRKKA
ncbi:16S rRNA (cytosine(967)-C(5))-methyltransferase RsmB [Thauera linaloolentis]|uniref:16S rRNA (cytosine(967)-C(5))-methyltransferase n=1 Tax=Thauera linaloolentis (strain DSM 12138 / JCM 21573 / CCUG 41526 / CIP 105981 / IAM 15112 / NBRC 102519 / 47Lol) TaxID=1123367 RepID=N6YZY7_THAL4|nr:16S rRNA (cytosine(967)-C(5))-methyltransferase RsmB [Thauera linaloolentis]ENO85474.1 16S rRNA methyltransferase B [Thauera linaloolentis 47Lol = DSM 12138]MCM8566513.1 16S rRNA (cytosine(967)-C(5))-methyltransferase RsmB [Thauera linaloolentis]